MNLQQCLNAAETIDRTYLEPVCSDISRDSSGKHTGHLRWMIQEMRNGMSEGKAMRWLGYIQGALVLGYGVPLDEMKEVSRYAVHGPLAQG